MPPRRSVDSTSAKRERSPSSSLSPPPKTAKRKQQPPTADDEHLGESAASASIPITSKAHKKARPSKAEPTEKPVIDDHVDLSSASPVTPKAKKKRAPKVKPDTEMDDGTAHDQNDDGLSSSPVKKPRTPKIKAWPPPELAPELHPPRAGLPVFQLPPLTVSPNGGIPSSSTTPRPHLVGAHVSIGEGVGRALLRAGMAGANGLAMFVKSQRQWKSNPFEPESIERFRALMKSKDEGGVGYAADSILVHGSYLINLANPDPAKWENSYRCFRDDIYRCHQLGIKLYNWHPGSTTGVCTRESSYTSIAKAINRVHQEVPEVICVIENMANANSNLIGTTFHDLASIISLVREKSRVRICLDTCHLFAAGYDIRTPEAYADVMRRFDEEVGNGFLGGMHLNDSKADFGACKDLHENIGLGKIGLSAFRSIMRDPLLCGIPLILETPAPDKALEFGDLAIWAREIKLLYEIQGIGDDEWVTREGEIEKRWRAERDLLNPPKPKEKGEGKKKGKKDKKGKGREEGGDGEVDGGEQGEDGVEGEGKKAMRRKKAKKLKKEEADVDDDEGGFVKEENGDTPKKKKTKGKKAKTIQEAVQQDIEMDGGEGGFIKEEEVAGQEMMGEKGRKAKKVKQAKEGVKEE